MYLFRLHDVAVYWGRHWLLRTSRKGTVVKIIMRTEADRIRKMDTKAFANWREREARLLKEIEGLHLDRAAERKKREEAERQISEHCKTCGYDILEAQVEVLQSVLQRILDEGCYGPESNIGHYCYSALTNPPARSAAIRKVLEAAEEQLRMAEEHTGSRRFQDKWIAACHKTEEAVRERREK